MTPFKSTPRIPLPKLGALLRSHFFAGVLVLAPLGVIVWLMIGAFGMLWQLPGLLPVEWRPEAWIDHPQLALVVNGLLTLALAAVAVILVSLLGWISTQYLGQKLFEALAGLIQRIPVIRSVYSALDQLLRTLTTGSGQQFSRVVYVEYPRKGCWALAFVTGPARGPQAPAHHLNVYVPTTPNPTSGFHLIVPENEVRESGMKVEEAFRTLLSLGIAQPSAQAAQAGEGAVPAVSPRGGE